MRKPSLREPELGPEQSDLVTIDATLMLALNSAKDRAFILDIEAMLLAFVQNPTYGSACCPGIQPAWL